MERWISEYFQHRENLEALRCLILSSMPVFFPPRQVLQVQSIWMIFGKFFCTQPKLQNFCKLYTTVDLASYKSIYWQILYVLNGPSCSWHTLNQLWRSTPASGMCLYFGQQPKDCFIQSNEIDVSDLCVVKEKKKKRKTRKNVQGRKNTNTAFFGHHAWRLRTWFSHILMPLYTVQRISKDFRRGTNYI